MTTCYSHCQDLNKSTNKTKENKKDGIPGRKKKKGTKMEISWENAPTLEPFLS